MQVEHVLLISHSYKCDHNVLVCLICMLSMLEDPPNNGLSWAKSPYETINTTSLHLPGWKLKFWDVEDSCYKHHTGDTTRSGKTASHYMTGSNSNYV